MSDLRVQPAVREGGVTTPILIVDDEDATLQGMRRALRSQGFADVVLCADPQRALAEVAAARPSIVLLDLIMPGLRGEELLARLTREHPDIPVVVVTADFEVRTIVQCMRLGAADYIVKPVDAEQLVATVQRALEQSALRYEATRLRERFLVTNLQRPSAFAAITTADPTMLRLFAYLDAVARGSHPVLIVGETGTGKELIARALHDAGARRGPFIAVNAAGLDDGLFSDTLFGHERGAFTGATTARQGMVDRAGDGTLFLDEIAGLSEASQVKLLRLIQEREYFPLGSDTRKRLRARVVAASHQDPSCLRQDLYYRLRSYEVRVPPLRERLGDLSLLVDRFLADAAADLGKPTPKIPPELLLDLANHDFPGNVRELQSIVFSATARHTHGVMPIHLFLDQLPARRATRDAVAPGAGITFPFPMPALDRITEAAVAEATRRVDGNRSAAARMLRVSRQTIARQLRGNEDPG